MNKTAMRHFAINARRELLERVSLQARKIGITKDKIEDASLESSDSIFINERLLTDVEREQRNKLITRIDEIGFDRVMEETAYTWFNRFIALRFMEVNDYLPTRVRVLSSENKDSTEPEMIKEALSLDLDIDKQYIYDLKMENNTEELFKYLIKLHCNDLNRYMPFMFETIEDYTAILFPEGLLGADSFVSEMTDTEVIPEDNWEKVEIIGWLYQYYIAEENERVIQAKKRYTKEEIPFATQLFTPEWIVRYMVQNALGRYWIESHPEDNDLIENWEFYLESQESKEELEAKLAPYINKELSVEEITCFDPAMGSGHILVYMFDVLYEIYSKSGYMEREIPRLIIENNLYGLDIDDRAYQLASFSIVMKALGYNRRFLRSIERDGLTMNLASIQETNVITDEEIGFLAGESTGEKFYEIKSFIDQFKHAKAVGSLIRPESYDFKLLLDRLKRLEQQDGDLFEAELKNRILPLYKNLVKQAAIMKRRYDVLITNPPYGGRRYLTKEITDYIDDKYPDVKSDLFSSFMKYSFYATKGNGQIGFITPFVWMFISSFETIRKEVVIDKNISTLIQLEYNGFEAAMVPVCLFTLRNYSVEIPGEYIKLTEFKGIKNQPIKTLEAVQNPSTSYRYSFYQGDFNKIPGSPVAFWLKDHLINVFENSSKLGDVGITRKGMVTADNPRFVRMWFEVDVTKFNSNAKSREDALISKAKWFPLQRGGEFKRWFGNQEYCVNWENDGYELLNMKGRGYKVGSTNHNLKFIFKHCITWTKLTSSKFSLRFSPEGFLCHDTGPFFYMEDKDELLYVLGMLNTKVGNYIIRSMNSTITFNPGDISKVPFLLSGNKEEIINIVRKNVQISKSDWDSSEISWNYKRHPLFRQKESSSKIEDSYYKWLEHLMQNHNQLKQNEEELNRIFIHIYGLKDDLTSEVDDEDVTIQSVDLERDIKSYISYAVGCTFGRYSLDEEGLVYAGGGFDLKRYTLFPTDENNILPILPDAYYENDIVTRFIKFIEVTYGKDTIDENLQFVANAIGRRKNETAREAIRRYFLNNFYRDHVQTYKKHPIYWLFTSGKEKAFNCLIYMHRYDKTTLSRIRTDYLHDVQTRYESIKQDLLTVIEGDSTAKEIRDAKKELKDVEKKIEELKKYDEKLHHMADMQIEIDLDDGVKVNYRKFEGLVAKI